MSTLGNIGAVSIAAIKRVLANVFNLFPLGGTTGGIVVRQKGGTPGTHEGWIYHDGSHFRFQPKTGNIKFYDPDGTLHASMNLSSVGTLAMQSGVEVGSATQGAVSRGFFPTGLDLTTTDQLTWRDGNFGTKDIGLVRTDVGVAKVTNGGAGAGWLQNAAGRARVTADVTNTTTTFANLTDLTITVKAGRKYTGWLTIVVNQALAADGFKLDMNGGTATMTDIEFGIEAAIGATLGTRTSTALATPITLTALADTNDVYLSIPISFTCNGAGTIIPRQAKNANAASGIMTTRKNSFFWLDDSPN